MSKETTGEVKADETVLSDGKKGYSCKITTKNGRANYGPPVENKYWLFETASRPLAESVGHILAAKGHRTSLEGVSPEGEESGGWVWIVRTTAGKGTLQRTVKKVVAEVKRLQAAA